MSDEKLINIKIKEIRVVKMKQLFRSVQTDETASVWFRSVQTDETASVGFTNFACFIARYLTQQTTPTKQLQSRLPFLLVLLIDA